MHRPHRRSLVIGSTAAGALALTAASGARAQPAGAPVRILVGFPAGGTIDIVARALADKLRDDLGAPVVVDNRPGAGGQLAAQALRQAPPDGRTFLLSPDHTAVILPLTVKNPGFDPLTDLVPVGQVASYLGAFAVSAQSGVTSFAQYAAWIRENPARASVGIPAPGSIPHFSLLAMGRAGNLPFTTVPYRGSAPLVQDLAAGQIPAGTTAMGDFLEFHRAGRLRILAVIDQRRSPLLPDVPTFVELGHRYDWRYWLGLFAPPQTPAALVDRTNAALGRALALPDVREKMAGIVFDPAPGTPAALGEQVRAGIRYWEPLVAASGWVAQ